MQPNPLLRALGLGPRDRAVIFHVDDIGMCQATLPALEELLNFGLVSSASIMAPCAWFPAAAAWARAHPDADLGVHLTLTSEWEAYRWGPLTTRDPASGLIDQEGYFPRDVASVHARAEPTAALTELAAQIERALAAGIDATHIDTHMGAVAHPKFMAGYVELARRYALPPMICRLDEAGWRAAGLSPDVARYAAAMVRQLEALGLPLLDHLVMLPLDQPHDRVALAQQLLRALPPGITHFIIHAACDTPEQRAIASDWPSRVADYEAFLSRELRDWVRDQGITVIGYRAIRDIMRGQEAL